MIFPDLFEARIDIHMSNILKAKNNYKNIPRLDITLQWIVVELGNPEHIRGNKTTYEVKLVAKPQSMNSPSTSTNTLDHISMLQQYPHQQHPMKYQSNQELISLSQKQQLSTLSSVQDPYWWMISLRMFGGYISI
jgi:hypothetical protein